MTVRYSLTTLALLGVCAAPAAAQMVDVRVTVDTQAVREAADSVRDALRDMFGPDTRLELRRELRTVTRDVTDAIGHLASAPWMGDGPWLGAPRQRSFTARVTDRDTRTFAIGPNGAFDLENLSGDIRITAGTGRDLTVEIHRESRARTEAEARTGLSRVRVETTHRGERVTARTVYPSGRQSEYAVSVSYVVTAPAGTRIMARTVSGDLTLSGIAGETSLHTTSGDISVTNAARLQSAKTVSGDIVLRTVGAEGQLDASTMSGDVTASGVKARRLEISSLSGTATVRDAAASAVSVKSMAGDVVFEGSLTAGGRYEFQSQTGTVRVALDERVGFTFEASTFAGSVASEFPLKVTSLGATGRRPARNLSGTFGDGSATVTATSFSGSVTLVRR